MSVDCVVYYNFPVFSVQLQLLKTKVGKYEEYRVQNIPFSFLPFRFPSPTFSTSSAVYFRTSIASGRGMMFSSLPVVLRQSVVR